MAKIEVILMGDSSRLIRALEGSGDAATVFGVKMRKAGASADELKRFSVADTVATKLRNFGKGGEYATQTIGGLKIAIAAMIPLALGFGGALVSVAGALAPLIGLGAAAGGSLLAVAQGMGALGLATSGIGAALKEQTNLQAASGGAATKNASSQRTAARAIQAAQDGIRSATDSLASAQRDAKDAQKDLTGARTEATRRLRDMRQQLAESEVAEARAVDALMVAKHALTTTLAGASPSQIRAAGQAVIEAATDQADAVLKLKHAKDELARTIAGPAPRDVSKAEVANTAASLAHQKAVRELADAQRAYAAVTRRLGVGDRARAEALAVVSNAENAVKEAQLAAQDAQDALDKLRAGPSDDEKAAALLAVKQAENDLTQAQAGAIGAQVDLNAARTPATEYERAKALLAVRDAELDLASATTEHVRLQKDFAAATAKGVKGSEEVVAAQRAIVDAEKAVLDAQRAVTRSHQDLKDAQESASESSEKLAAGGANLNKAFDALPPAAQRFVRVLQGMKPKLDELRATAAQGLFPGVTAGLQAAMGSFSSVNKVLGETAEVMGHTAKKGGELVGSPAFGRDIETVGHNNAKALGIFGNAALHVVNALRHVAVVAGPLTLWLARTVNGWAANAEGAAKAGRESGKLAAFFDRTRAVAERVISIVTHLTSALIGVGSSGSKSGNDILKSIDAAAKRFDAWANSVAGRKDMQEFFRKTKELAAALTDVLGGAAGAVAIMSLRVLPLTTAIKVLGPYTDEAVKAFIAWKVAMIAASVASKGLAVGIAVATFATGGWTAAFWRLNAALVANPVGLVVLAIGGLVAALVLAWKHSETFRNIVTGAFNTVKDVAKTAFGLVKTAAEYGLLGPIGLVITHWRDAVGILTSTWNTIKTTATTAWNGIKSVTIEPVRDAVSWVVEKIGGLAGSVKSGLGKVKDAAVEVGEGIRDAVTWPFRMAWDKISEIVNKIGKLIKKLKDAPGKLLGGALDLITGNNAQGGKIGHAQGGHVVRRVGELGPENVALPVGSTVFQASESRGSGGGMVVNYYGPIGSQHAARVAANQVAYRLQNG